jgi:hypothetical protein
MSIEQIPNHDDATARTPSASCAPNAASRKAANQPPLEPGYEFGVAHTSASDTRRTIKTNDDEHT